MFTHNFFEANILLVRALRWPVAVFLRVTTPTKLLRKSIGFHQSKHRQKSFIASKDTFREFTLHIHERSRSKITRISPVEFPSWEGGNGVDNAGRAEIRLGLYSHIPPTAPCLISTC